MLPLKQKPCVFNIPGPLVLTCEYKDLHVSYEIPDLAQLFIILVVYIYSV